MTPAEFKSARKALGLTVNALASELRTNERTIRRWEHGDISIPHTAVLAMKYLAGLPYERQPDHAEAAWTKAMRGATFKG